MSSFIYVVILHIVAWVYGWVVQEKYTANPPSFDWEDEGFVEGLFVLLLWRTYEDLFPVTLILSPLTNH